MAAETVNPSCEEHERWYRVGFGSKGRGLFSNKAIPPRTLIHVAPCISKSEYDNHMKYTILEHYLFNDRKSGDKLLALGDGSLFNHSKHPNVDYRIEVASGTSEYSEIRFSTGHSVVEADEELCISYGSNLWFDDADGDDEGQVFNSSDNDGNDEVDFLRRLQL